MNEIKLTNVLTDEEKAQVSRLIEHDGSNSLAIVFQGDPLDPNNTKYHSHARKASSIWETISFLGADHLTVETTESKYSKESRELPFEDISTIYQDRATFDLNSKYDINMYGDFSSPLFVVLSNLVKNTIKHGKSPCHLSIKDFQGFPSDAVYVPQGARNYSKFVEFKVHDSGRGFPRVESGQTLFQGEGFPTMQEQDYLNRLTTLPKKGEQGFGLYFTGLVAKVLQAPVGIKSVPRDTTVSFYHPVYIKE